jgi:ribosomal protein S18 acetylase RimI-like enzyme
MYLEDIIITEEYRGKGLGKLLFDQLIIEAVERNLKGITWQVLEWNEDAIEFYKKYNATIDPEWVNGSLTEEQIQGFYKQYKA